MKKKDLFITVGIISLLLTLVLAGCSGDTLKASQHSSGDDTITEGETVVEGETTTEGEPVGEGEPVTDEGSVPEPTENPETNCSTLNPHPLAISITEQYEITYDEVMTLYCDGYAFSDILLALETEGLVDQSTEELLLLLETSTWEEIWQDLGVELD
jgi:hypothetical protein